MTSLRPRTRPAPTVIKIGGSVLTGPKAYPRAARWLQGCCGDAAGDRDPLGLSAPVLVVVSAENGVTDRLLAEAASIAAVPDSRALDLLWATGELRSAALLALHLQAIGVAACALNVHETGLHRHRTTIGARVEQLAHALGTHAVVVVPGFLGCTARGAIVSLGRGGSDLSAVTLAATLAAPVCELIKDVPGYFTADPAAHPDARHIPHIDFDTALAMAAAGCDLVQAAALEAARAQGVRLVIRTTEASSLQTVVSHTGASDEVCHEDDSRRAAVGA